MKLYLDPGHGGTDPGAQGNGIREKDIALDIAKKIKNILLAGYQNIEVRMSRENDMTKSLSQRTSEANSWGADFYLSIHCNAANGAARGYEDFIHNSLGSTSQTAGYQNIIHAEVTKLNELIDRGKKKADFHVLRESAMPALLTENGFIDNSADAALMKDPLWRQRVAQGHVNGIAKAFSLKAKPAVPPQPPKPVDPSNLYRVIAGSFTNRKNAEERSAVLKNKSIESVIATAEISGTVWYRVQAGAFSTKENAEKQLETVKKAGITDAYILSDAPPAVPSEPKGYSILGVTHLSPEHMNQYAKQVNPNAANLGSFYSAIGEYYGIRGDIAFAQAMHETNFLRFTGDVKPGQNNFAGIGATGNGTAGASFSTQEEGVLAHIQHLYAYASTQPLPPKYPLADPRFSLVKRGSAKLWQELNGKWAVPGTNYAESILNIYKNMVRFSEQKLEAVLKDVEGS
ncbi:N-acetylmuramoyl-L-alanine amidase [Cytobacillus firmus]|uniref:N-acetylmuramoyl-L-alanine amidase n=1 Tax=Cytobacillus firmus TaxID=1399 RepID=UPI0018CCFB42|nr:N-acetylmuramoyl-L-alanine amidase [Cytobacillus firmus]MBG9657134.1 sporulation specific N-acetylmuramoyl-L-alanine amidase [Cytobacillus firmus]MED1908285.1 N-acetylmuramoyl-L-alanine amidase [Cytobacillus firmus]